MISIYIFADSYKVYEAPIKEYQKRLWKQLNIVQLKPIKNQNDFLIIEKETAVYQKLLKTNKWYNIVLSPEGKKLSTKSFYDLLEKQKQIVWDINFYVWWANGLHYDELKNVCDLELSLSDFTLPHSLALLVLTEQVYRSAMIKKWTHYNK